MRKLAALLFVVGLLLAARAGAATSSDAIAQVFGNSRMARCIASHESHLNARAVSRTHDLGLFQINADTWLGRVVTWARGPRGFRRFYVQRRFIFDPVYNARVAFVISRGGTDWSPWSTLRFCR